MSARAALCLVLTGCGAATSTAPTTPTPEPDTCTVAVRVEDAEMDTASEDVVPRMMLTMVRICEHDGTATEVLPIESGVCTPVAPERGSLAAASCWWAGAGSVVEIFRVGDELVARRTSHEEEAPPGEPVEIGRLTLPAGADTTSLGL